jgi:hypothetical protein
MNSHDELKSALGDRRCHREKDWGEPPVKQITRETYDKIKAPIFTKQAKKVHTK